MEAVIAIEKNGQVLRETTFELSGNSEVNRQRGIKALNRLIEETAGVSWGDDFVTKHTTRG